MTIDKPAQGRIVLITGASSGIGASTAIFLAQKGFIPLLIARREDKLREISDEITKTYGKAYYFPCDLSKEEERMRLFDTLQEQALLPDILINNAGFAWYGYFVKMPWQIARELLAVNIEAVTHLTALFLPAMLEKNSGHIINIGSISGKLPEQGIALYSSSKAYMNSFTTSLFRELRGTGIKVSVIRAGPIKTEFYDTARKLDSGGSVPAERLAVSVDRVTKGILYLIKHPRKVMYIPGWLIISPLLETFFSWIIDLVGPLLLKKTSKIY